MREIQVLLAEDHTIVRKGLRALLNDISHINIVDEVENGQEAVERTKLLRPDIVLMDISMPKLNGIEATRRIKSDYPKTGVIILTMHGNAEYVIQALDAGAESYVLKKSAPEELVTAIEKTCRNGSYISPLISKEILETYERHGADLNGLTRYEGLTKREREVLQLVAEGNNIRDIAKYLVISEKTARVHRKNLMDKLELHSVAKLTLYALRIGVIALET